MKQKLNCFELVYGIFDLVLGALFLFSAINDFKQATSPNTTAESFAFLILIAFILAFVALIFLFGIIFLIYGVLFILASIKFKNKSIVKRWMIISILILQIIVLICLLPFAIESTGISQVLRFVEFGLLVVTVTLKITDLVINNKKLKLNNNDIISGKETKNSDSVVINKDNEN